MKEPPALPGLLRVSADVIRDERCCRHFGSMGGTSKVTLINSAGPSHAPVLDPHPTTANNTPPLGQPTTMRAGRGEHMLLFFVLPAGTTPKTVTSSSLGSAVPALCWYP